MSEHDSERINRKLDELLVIMHGDSKGGMGLVQRVDIIWMVVLKWPLYIAGIITGAALTVGVQRILQ